MKVCHLTSVHPYFDTRIFHKEAKSLALDNHEVVVIAQHDKKESIEGITVIPLPRPKNRWERMTKITLRLFVVAIKEHADIYHFHDPELLPVGILLKLFTKAGIIYDVHEDYSKLMLEKQWIAGSLLKKVMAFLFNIFERVSVRLLDKVIVVTPEIARKFPEIKTEIVRNFVSLDVIDSITPVKSECDKAVIIYMGSLEKNRGIREIIQAVDLLDGAAELWLLGQWDTPELQKECKNTKGWDYTRYFGNKKPEEAYSYLKAADIGLHCVNLNDYYLQGLPTKVFEYAACSKPAIISYSPYWEKLFGEFVLFVDPRSPEDIAEKMLKLLNNKDLRSQLGDRARAFVEKKHNWETERIKLYAVYKSVFKERSTHGY